MVAAAVRAHVNLATCSRPRPTHSSRRAGLAASSETRSAISPGERWFTAIAAPPAQHHLSVSRVRATPKDLRAHAVEAKAALWEENVSMWRAVGLIDALINVYAPDPGWIYNFLEFQQPPQPPSAATMPNAATRPSRQIRTVEIAQQMIREGASGVRTEDIARALSKGGDQTAVKNLIVSVGNTLNRSGWRRVGNGLYEPQQESDVRHASDD